MSSLTIAMHPFQEYERLGNPIQHYFSDYYSEMIDFVKDYYGLLMVFEESRKLENTMRLISELRVFPTVFVITERESNTPLNLKKNELMGMIKEHVQPVLLTGGNIQKS